MGRGTRAEQAPAANSMIASAVRLPSSARGMRLNKQQWQAEAWAMYDAVGELRYAANWFGNVLSRTILHVVKKDAATGTWEIVKIGSGVDALNELFGGADGQAEMLKSIGINFFVAGECYLVGRKPRPERDEQPGDDIWEIVSTEEMNTGAGGGWTINYDDGMAPILLTEDEVVIRLWNPHPRKRMTPDSPTRAALPVLRELLLLSRRVTAQARSQIAGNGLVFIPSEMSFPPDPDRPNLTAAEALMSQLGEAMLDAIEDPSSPAAVVPVIASAPGEYLDKVQKLDFWTPYDEQLPVLRKEAIGRAAVTLDVPAEVLLGTADLNHWSAWQVEESSIKINIEPALETVARCITTGYLWDITSDTEEQIGADTSKLRLRPNRSKEAIELWDRGELSAEAMRRETGFDESDAPDQEEYIRWLLNKIAGGSATPEMVAQAAALLGVKGIEAEGDVTNQARPDRSLEDHPTRDIPEQDIPRAASLRDKSEVLVLRAMERSGNRLRSIKQMRPDCAAYEAYRYIKAEPGDLDKVLEDAWSVIPVVFSELPEFERHVVMQALDTYCRHLLLTQQPFNRAEMERFLTTTPVRELA